MHTPVADLLGDAASRYPGATRFLPYPLWTVCADGTVALYDPLENGLRRIGETGRPSGTVTLPEEQGLEVTAERLFTMVTLPEPFTPFRFEADRIWGTVQDEMGVASVAWIGADALR